MGVFQDGSTFTLKPLLIRLPSPLFLAVHFVRSPVRGIVDLLSVVRAGLGILSFETKRDFSDLDRFTFRSWLWRLGVSEHMYQAFFEPYVRSFAFDSATRISAAATLSSYHFYLVRHQDDIRVRWLTDDPDSLIIQPLVEYIRQHGGRVVTSNRVEGLLQDSNGRIVSVQTSQSIAEHVQHEPKGMDALTRIDSRAIPEKGFRTIQTEHAGQIDVGYEDGTVVAYAKSDRKVPSSATGPGTFSQLRVDLTSGGVVVRTPEPKGAGAEVDRLRFSEIPEHGFKLRKPRDDAIYVGRNRGQEIALSARCTHMGCEVAWKTDAGKFECPCHGATFGPDGTVLGGPAKRPLEKYTTRVEDGDFVVLENKAAASMLEADHFILAVDVEACKRLLSRQLREHETFRNIDYLATTPALVVRLWFPGNDLLGARTAGVFIDYPLLDNFFVLSNMQKSFRGGNETVVEVQAYLVEDEIELSNDRLLPLVLQDLRQAFPSLNVSPSKSHIQRHGSVFTHHTVGSDKYRPDTRTPVPNLHLAGDWVSRSPEVWNMERAVVTGRLAAAAVVEDAGGVGPMNRSLPSGGALFRMFVRTVGTMADVVRWVGRLARGDVKSSLPLNSYVPHWRSTILVGVYKFRGEPNEQLVTGRFRDVTGHVEVVRSKGTYYATGNFCIDLELFDSGNTVRDYNVRTLVFDTPRRPFAEFQLIEACPVEPVAGVALLNKEIRVDCRGRLTLNAQTQRLCFQARATLLKGGLVSVRSVDDIVFRAADFGLNVEALRQRCDAVVDDEVRLSFRLAVPYVMKTESF